MHIAEIHEKKSTSIFDSIHEIIEVQIWLWDPLEF